mmetsp:Transcript_17551/g.26495  ORF Transcript_17551/g.26495 Transcript_17551/m.26495 type:complete len:97 (-) Transcript_17551:514-804(-)
MMPTVGKILDIDSPAVWPKRVPSWCMRPTSRSAEATHLLPKSSNKPPLKSRMKDNCRPMEEVHLSNPVQTLSPDDPDLDLFDLPSDPCGGDFPTPG